MYGCWGSHVLHTKFAVAKKIKKIISSSKKFLVTIECGRWPRFLRPAHQRAAAHRSGRKLED